MRGESRRSQRNDATTEEGRIEIGVDRGREDSIKAKASNDSSTPRWIAVVSLCAILAAVGGGLVVAASGGDEHPGSANSITFEDEPGFQPYAGGSVIAEREEEPQQPVARPQEEPEPEPDIADEEPERVQGDLRPAGPFGDKSVNHRRPDGVEILEDTRGVAMSREEAERRLEGELKSIEEADTDYQQRLRRRDVQLNSRVVQANSLGDLRITPGLEVTEDVRKRLQQQLSGAHAIPDRTEGVDRDNYHGVDEDDW